MKNQGTNANKALIIVGLYFLAALIGGWILKRNMVLGAALAKLPVNLLVPVQGSGRLIANFGPVEPLTAA